MRGKWSMQTAVAALCLLSVMVVLVSAECPNGCSGNGDCQSKDMCNCYMNYQGNDCADRTCLFGHAFVDTPKGDINMDKDRLTPGWLLLGSQQHPAKTYEHFNPDAIADEAHFYMECSNKGICDRSTGLCQCFDGYEGNGCRRMTCPSKCSGHGTCESIRELGLKAGGTLFGNEGAAGPVKYDLWDANSTYGCRCDPWYHGPDCAKRSCKVGVDPLFLSAGNPTYETFIIHAYAPAATIMTDAWIRLRLFDYHGESYITSKIPVTIDSAASAIVVANAIKAVPNLTFRKVTCEAANSGTNLANYMSVRTVGTLGFSVVCQFNDNPGKMRLPEFAGSNIVTGKTVVTTTQQGMNDEWFTTKTTSIVTVPFTPGTTLTVAPAVPLTLAFPALIKVGPHIALVTAGTTALTLEYALQATIGADTAVFMADPTLITLTAGPVTSVDTLVEEDFLTFAADPTGAAHPIGSTLFFQNAFYTVQGVSTDVSTNWFLKLDKPFPGGSLDGLLVTAGAKAFKVELSTDAKSKTYNYISECSGRGMCGYDTGVCTCFKGYTNDNCDTQNILAL